jgi:hypothetical protein
LLFTSNPISFFQKKLGEKEAFKTAIYQDENPFIQFLTISKKTNFPLNSISTRVLSKISYLMLPATLK